MLLCPWGFSRQEYEWVAMPPSKDRPNPGMESKSPTLQADSLLSESPGKPKNTGVGTHTLLQGSSQPRDQTQFSHSAGRLLPSEPLGKPIHVQGMLFQSVQLHFSQCLPQPTTLFHHPLFTKKKKMLIIGKQGLHPFQSPSYAQSLGL